MRYKSRLLKTKIKFISYIYPFQISKNQFHLQNELIQANMIEIETTTIGKFHNQEAAEQALRRVTRQGYTKDNIYIYPVLPKSKKQNILEVLIGLGSIIGLVLILMNAYLASPIVLFLLMVATIFGGILTGQHLYEANERAAASQPYFLLKATSVEEAKALKIILGATHASTLYSS